MRKHLTYSNVMVTILALLVVGGGGAYAAGKLKIKKDSVTTTKIKNGHVRGPDLGADAVDASKIQDGQVTSSDLGGDAVDSSKIKDGSVDTSDVAGSLLNDRSVGRSVAGGSCNPPPLVECRGLDMTLPRPARVLIFADALVGGNANDGDAAGACQISIDGNTPLPGSELRLSLVDDAAVYEAGLSLSQVTGVLSAGSHHFGLNCSETDADVEFSDFHLSAISLSAE